MGSCAPAPPPPHAAAAPHRAATQDAREVAPPDRERHARRSPGDSMLRPHPLLHLLVPVHNLPQLHTLLAQLPGLHPHVECRRQLLACAQSAGLDGGDEMRAQGHTTQPGPPQKPATPGLASSSTTATRVLVDMRAHCTALRSSSNVTPCTWQTLAAVTRAAPPQGLRKGCFQDSQVPAN